MAAAPPLPCQPLPLPRGLPHRPGPAGASGGAATGPARRRAVPGPVASRRVRPGAGLGVGLRVVLLVVAASVLCAALLAAARLATA
ncbi:hypothetical protein CCS92_34485, partial [Methylobacterium radiotolerans]